MGQETSIARDTIVWQVDQLTDLAANTSEVFHCKFVTTPTDIEWLQKSDSFSNNFSVLNTEGSWNDLSNDGRYTFHVSFNGENGNLYFERVNGIVQITMSFIDGEKNKMPYLFRVSNYSKK
jgi:hypothetical protein